MKTIQFLLKNYIKRSKLKTNSGFTLAELLVALVMAFLIITPLFSFMLNILNTDRQEQAKANSEQEIQSALDYISRDLQQAIYIYDATGVDEIASELPTINDEKVPVLVFWKRKIVEDVLTVTNTETGEDEEDDTFVYSLVAYYLIKDSNATWSNAARIARWELSDGVTVSSGGVSCDGYTSNYVSGYCPDSGFAPFSLEGVGTLEQKMNDWTRLSSYDTTTTDADGNETTTTTTVGVSSSVVLLDYIDQTTTTNGAPAATCVSGSKVPPASFATDSINTGNMTNITGFYACVDLNNVTAQVFLRGNALARIQGSNFDYNNNKTNYFPTASVRVEGRGFLFTE